MPCLFHQEAPSSTYPSNIPFSDMARLPTTPPLILLSYIFSSFLTLSSLVFPITVLKKLIIPSGQKGKHMNIIVSHIVQVFVNRELDYTIKL